MEETLIAIWAVVAGVLCILGGSRILRDVHRAMNADEEIKRAIREGEIDNLTDEYGKEQENS